VPHRVLITGITGFAGSHLAERLVADGVTVEGIALDGSGHPNLARIASHVRVHHGDITSADDVRAAMRASRPDAVVHLAGQAVPTAAARDPVAAVRANVLGTATVLNGIEESDASIVIASSAEVYGTPERALVDEGTPVRPENPYAATKVAAEALASELGDRLGSRRTVVILRATNQIGPRQHPGLAASAFAKQIAEAESGAGGAGPGTTAVVRHGSLDARRDFLDVRDMADAYARAAEISRPGAHVFNVGTGHAVAISEILAALIELARVDVHTEVDPALVRSGQAPHFALDAKRFRDATGWEPKIELKESLKDLLDYWREQVLANAGRRAAV
jgi:GDP-4-dehydro-6-deoxy-D-mannose reductase